MITRGDFFMANAATKVRNAFIDAEHPLTLSQIKDVTQLKASEISMALCYLRKWRYVTRDLTRSASSGRKNVWIYTYHKTALPRADQ